MKSVKLGCLLFCIMIIIRESHEAMFMRTILAYGLPFYKILLSLGTCKDHVLFKERKIWTAVKMNRILDIYYSSDDVNFKVSRVEINLVINNTDCTAVSDKGVGSHKLSATLFLPLAHGTIFYQLIIFTCSQPQLDSVEEELVIHADDMNSMTRFDKVFFNSTEINDHSDDDHSANNFPGYVPSD